MSITMAKKRKRKQKHELLGGIESAASKPSGLPRNRRPNPYAACVAQFGHDGKVYLYLNAGIQQGHHPSEGICPQCKHAYSHVIERPGVQCRECDGDDIAMAAMQLEQAGINLGWGFREHTRDYERERMRVGRPTARIQQSTPDV